MLKTVTFVNLENSRDPMQYISNSSAWLTFHTLLLSNSVACGTSPSGVQVDPDKSIRMMLSKLQASYTQMRPSACR